MCAGKLDTKKEVPQQIVIDGLSLTTKDVFLASQNPKMKVVVSEKALKGVKESRQILNDFISDGRIIYGVNTGVGGFVDWLIPEKDSGKLQENLIAAVSTNVGAYLDDPVSRSAILVRLNSLARGNSAISPENFNKLLEMYNRGVIPCIPSKGSLGASGDLGPLGYIALVGIGKWKAKYQGEILSGKDALKKAGIKPMKLGFKEGLSLVNGTSVMTALASLLVEKTSLLIKTYDFISCLSFEGLAAKKKAFHPTVHRQKPHLGQLRTAENIWEILKDSQMAVDEAKVERHLQSYSSEGAISTKAPIEDAYSIRCTPQVIGPIRDTIKWIRKIVEDETNSSNDNPLVIPEEREVFHNGHFHGQYISMAMDYLSISLTTLSNLSDRRIDRFMDQSNSNGLPPFLCRENPGLRLGLMGGQFMASSITAENRALCHPLSIQTLTTTGDFQDIVSMGLVAARRAQEIYENAVYILAFELLCAAQAAEIRGINLLSSPTKAVFSAVRTVVPYLSTDECITDYLEDLAMLIKSSEPLKAAETALGKTLEP